MYTIKFEIGKKKYPRQVIVDDRKIAWWFTDDIDNAIQDLCENVAKLLADDKHPMPEDFGSEFYDKVDVGGLRDAIILAAEDIMDCEFVWEYRA